MMEKFLRMFVDQGWRDKMDWRWLLLHLFRYRARIDIVGMHCRHYLHQALEAIPFCSFYSL